tara:strand:- start:727 stop:1350 length:624 start_codon:yes stop_codon:yes gene_type:complete
MNLTETLVFILIMGQILFLIFTFYKTNKYDTNFNNTSENLGNHIKSLKDDFDKYKVITMHKIHTLEEKLDIPKDWKDEIIIDKDNKWGEGKINENEWSNIADLIKETKYPTQEDIISFNIKEKDKNTTQEDISSEWRDLKIGSKVSFLKINPRRKGITLNKWYEVHNLYKYKDDIDGQRFSFKDDNNKTRNQFKPNPTFEIIKIKNE